MSADKYYDQREDLAASRHGLTLGEGHSPGGDTSRRFDYSRQVDAEKAITDAMAAADFRLGSDEDPPLNIRITG